MERRISVIPGPALNRGIVDAKLAEAVKPIQKRTWCDGATVKVVPDCAWQVGPTRAGKKQMEAPVTTIENWLQYFRTLVPHELTHRLARILLISARK